MKSFNLVVDRHTHSLRQSFKNRNLYFKKLCDNAFVLSDSEKLNSCKVFQNLKEMDEWCENQFYSYTLQEV